MRAARKFVPGVDFHRGRVTHFSDMEYVALGVTMGPK